MKLSTKIAYRLFPPHVWSVLMWEAKLSLGRLGNHVVPRHRRVIKDLGRVRNLKIHLGCGDRVVPGWVNVDGIAKTEAVVRWDCRYPLPFADSSADMIFSEHLLEHLTKDHAVGLLKECFRVLAAGGRVRLGVPDAELYLRAYAANQAEFFRGLERLGGAVEPLSAPIDVVNQMFRMGGHHLFAWDWTGLSQALQSVGFVEVTRWEPGSASCAEIRLDDPNHAFETLHRGVQAHGSLTS